jgi:hypothetical protein
MHNTWLQRTSLQPAAWRRAPLLQLLSPCLQQRPACMHGLGASQGREGQGCCSQPRFCKPPCCCVQLHSEAAPLLAESVCLLGARRVHFPPPLHCVKAAPLHHAPWLSLRYLHAGPVSCCSAPAACTTPLLLAAGCRPALLHVEPVAAAHAAAAAPTASRTCPLLQKRPPHHTHVKAAVPSPCVL